MARLFNKGKRTIVYGKPVLIDGKLQRHRIAPQKIDSQISDEDAAIIKKQFPHELVDLDNKEDLQAQFEEKKAPVKEAKPEEKKADDRDAKEAAVAIAVAAAEKAEKDANEPAKEPEPETGIIQKIDAMDRAQIIAFIEKYNLSVEHTKLKNPDALKRAVLVAYEESQKKAA